MNISDEQLAQIREWAHLAPTVLELLDEKESTDHNDGIFTYKHIGSEKGPTVEDNIVTGKIVIGGVTFSADGIALTPGVEATNWARRFVGSFNANAEAEKRGAVKALRDALMMTRTYQGREFVYVSDLQNLLSHHEKGADR